MISGLSSGEVRPAGRAPTISTNWSDGDGGLEEVDTATGWRTDGRTPSRLCRLAMFVRWQQLQQQVGQSQKGPKTNCNYVQATDEWRNPQTASR